MTINFVKIRVPLKGLSEETTIDFASDLHLRIEENLEEFMEVAQQFRSGNLLLAGDYSENHPLIEKMVSSLGTLDTNVIAIFGNNDRIYKAAFFMESKKYDNIAFYQDEILDLNGINLLCAHDRQEGQWLVRSLPETPLIILAHSPDMLLQLPESVPFTFLAGHVHGGQFRIPQWPWWWTHTEIGRAHADGYSKRGENDIFVGRGIGYSLMNLRNVPKEVYEITFCPA